MYNEAYYKPFDIVTKEEAEPPKIKRIPPAGAADVKTEILASDLAYMKHRVMELEANTRNYIPAEEFEPIRKVVYGLISMILLAIVGAMVSLTISG